jgi:hypothetical protein
MRNSSVSTFSLAKTAICVVDSDGAVRRQGKVSSEPGPLIKRLAEWFGNIEPSAGGNGCGVDFAYAP